MIRINLLAPESIKKEERNEFIVLGFVLVFIVFACLAAVYFVKLQRLHRIETRIAQVNTELGKYETIVKQVETLEATKKILETQKNVISSLRSGGLVYPVFMEELSGVLPSGVGLILNTQLQTDGSMTVSFDAEAVDNYTIADCLTSFSRNKSFSSIELGPVAISSDKKPVSTFKINCVYKSSK